MAAELGRYFRKLGRVDFAKRQTMPWLWTRNNAVKREIDALSTEPAAVTVEFARTDSTTEAEAKRAVAQKLAKRELLENR